VELRAKAKAKPLDTEGVWWRVGKTRFFGLCLNMEHS